MKKYSRLIPIVIFLCFLAFFIYWLGATLDPDSTFCVYKIYKQPDGTYQVWWVNKSSNCELSGATYEQAKAFQRKECKELREFMNKSPQGDRVK